MNLRPKNIIQGAFETVGQFHALSVLTQQYSDLQAACAERARTIKALQAQIKGFSDAEAQLQNTFEALGLQGGDASGGPLLAVAPGHSARRDVSAPVRHALPTAAALTPPSFAGKSPFRGFRSHLARQNPYTEPTAAERAVYAEFCAASGSRKRAIAAQHGAALNRCIAHARNAKAA